MTAPAPLFREDERRDAALTRIAEAFAAAQMDDPRREARLLLIAALGITPAEYLLRPEAPLGAAASRLKAAVEARLGHVPHARIFGTREFFGLDFSLNAATLIPRPDTEVLVEAVLHHAIRLGMHQRPVAIIDLGTGSGAILTALLSDLDQASGMGTDLSLEALTAAKANLERHLGPDRARFVQSDWFAGIEETFEIIVSNPPYIASADIPGLAPEVATFEPLAALDGGLDGLDAYRSLAGQCAARLKPGGLIALEVGAGQAADVANIFAAAGFAILEIRKDLGGHERVLVLARSS